MKNIRLIGFAFLMALLAVSCVSQKKYDELDALKRKGDAAVRKLTAENNEKAGRIEQLIDEFNEMKNDLAESNAKKDAQIDAASSKVYGLSSDQKLLKEELDAANEKYQWARKSSLAKDKKIEALTQQLGRFKKELTTTENQLELVTEEGTETTGKLNEKIRDLNKKIISSKAEIERLNNENASLKKMIEELEASVSNPVEE